MTPYYSDAQVTIYHGDCREVLPTLDPVETCITDPPYGLSFMGKAWDHAVPDETYWRLVLDAVKPGGLLMAFGGTRLWHWLAVGIEQGGWEIRDTLMWLYGSGFPKSLDISKAIDKAAGVEGEWVQQDHPGRAGHRDGDANIIGQVGRGLRHVYQPGPAGAPWSGYGTALKPAWEPVILAMRPLDGTFAENALRHGVAGLNVDGGRIGTGGQLKWSTPRDMVYHGGSDSEGTPTGNPVGRWPANLLLDGEAAALLDEQVPNAGGGFVKPYKRASHDYYSGQWPDSHGGGHDLGGGASRFFYTAKASRSERGEFNTHPTVKPLDLMAYLCRLTATPTGGTVLDPFMGSGSTLIAAMRAGRRAIGVELDEAHCEIAVKRLIAEPFDLFGGAA